MDSPYFLIAVAAIFLLAGLVKGVIGMGLPTVAVGLLGLMISPAQAAAILIVPSLLSNLWQAAVGGHGRALIKRLWPMFVGIAVGTFLGAVYLPRGGAATATGWLGLALAVYGLLGLVRIEFRVPPSTEIWLGPLAGMITGFISVATGVFVVPGVPYLQALEMERDKLVQALGLFFTVSTVTLGLALQHAGEINSGLLWPSLIALVVVLIGMRLGQWVRTRVKPQTFRLFFYCGMLGLGLHLASRGLL